MHQIFYIDIDEEIASLADRLRKSKERDVYFVIPKRAIIFQGIVSLKLLKREADRQQKNVFIVTQDEHGKMLSDKVGLTVRLSLDGLESHPNGEIQEKSKIKRNANKGIGEHLDQQTVLTKGMRLNAVGSDDFFGDADSSEHIITSESKVIVRNAGKRDISRQTPVAIRAQRGDVIQLRHSNSPQRVIRNKMRAHGDNENRKHQQEKDLALEKLFSKEKNDFDQQIQIPNGRGIKRFFLVFLLICFVALAGVGLYMFVPSVDIAVHVKNSVESEDIELSASMDPSLDGPQKIALRVLEKEEELTMTYESSGKSAATSGQKAKGIITIYNEFNSSPQALVATTRFATEDGKIFRLTKGVTVPGIVKVGQQIQPGVTEAEVSADLPGEQFNIAASQKFLIPGFEGSEKYEKFYAKSTKAFTGGSINGSNVSSVSAYDIESSKQANEKKLVAKSKEQIKSSLSEDEILLDEAFGITSIDVIVGAKAGEAKQNFDIKTKAKVKALIFSKKDVEKISNTIMNKKRQDYKEETLERTELEYGQASADFSANTLSIKVHSQAYFRPSLDLDRLKTQLLGKNTHETTEVFRAYPQIGNVDLEFRPPFLDSRLPQYAKRITITVDSLVEDR